MPPGVDDRRPERYSRSMDEKYYWFAHAEENAIGHAAQRGSALHGAALVSSAPPCHICARLIIKAGIHKVWFDRNHELYVRHSNQPSLKRANCMFEEAGVEVFPVSGVGRSDVTE